MVSRTVGVIGMLIEIKCGRLALVLVLVEHARTKVYRCVCHCGLVEFLLPLVIIAVDICCRRFAVDAVLLKGCRSMRMEGGMWVIRYREEVVWWRRDGDIRGRGG